MELSLSFYLSPPTWLVLITSPSAILPVLVTSPSPLLFHLHPIFFLPIHRRLTLADSPSINLQARRLLQNTRPNTNLPYHDTVTFDSNGDLVTTPADVRLSDQLVFPVITHHICPGKLRSGRWPADFNSDSDIIPEHWPMGGAVVVWAHGVPFLPVFSDCYILTGAKLRHYPWNLDTKHRHGDMIGRRLHFGEIVAPPSEIGDNALHMDDDEQVLQRFPVVPILRCSRYEGSVEAFREKAKVVNTRSR